MTLIAQRTITGAEVRPNVSLDRRRRRLSTIVKRHADDTRPFIVTVHRLGQEAVAPSDLNVVMIKEWKDKLVGSNDVVLITYLPLGGGGGGKGGMILMAVAAIALAIIAPYAIGALGAAVPGLGLGTVGALTTLGKIAATGLTMGVMALLSNATKPKANKVEEQRPVYGVSGGGNLPRAGDRIPRLYGRCWTVPDLSQPDFFRYDGETQILYKLMTVSLGRVLVRKVRVNGQIMATSDDGHSFDIKDPFKGSKIEAVFPNDTSKLVPETVISSPSVQGNELARPDNPVSPWTGHFVVNGPDADIDLIQLDISAPGGLVLNYSNSKGAQESGVRHGWKFEYRSINENGSATSGWKVLDSYSGTRLERRPVRWTIRRRVPLGRYEVRGQNLFTNVPFNDKETNVTNALQWDGLRGEVPGRVRRPNVTQLAMEIRSSAALAVTSFSNVEVEAESVLPVWNGSFWENKVTNKCVWIYADVMRNQAYGGGLPDSSLDLETLKFYADALTRYDTFDGVIRGPDSVWNVAAAVLFPMRAEPVQLGRVWSIVRDDRKDIRPQVITARQIVGGSSALAFKLDGDDGEAHYQAEYYRGADPKRLTPVRNTVTGDDIYIGNKSITPTRRNLFGVSSLGHATHLTWWLAAAAFYRRQTVRFQTEYDGRLFSRGTPLKVETWFASKSKLASVIERSGDTLTLDRYVPVSPGDQIILRDRSGREWGPIPCANGLGNDMMLNAAYRAQVEASTGISLGNALGQEHMEDTTVLVGQVAAIQRSYLVRSAKPAGRDRIDIEAVIDHPAVWATLNEPILDYPDPADAPDPLPPDNLAVTERLYLDGNDVKAAARISWRRTDPRALTFEVEYRVDFKQVQSEADPEVIIEESATDDQWISAGVTDGTSIEILDIPAAQIDVRVRSVYTATGISTWANLNDVVIAGVLKPPSDVTGFEASVLGDVMTLSWQAVTDIHLHHYEVRFSPSFSGVQWGAAVPLVSRVPSAGTQVPAAPGTYLVKAVSRAGITSANAAFIISDVAGIAQMNVVEVFTEQPAFSGAKDEVILNTSLNGLQLDSASKLFERDSFFEVASFFYGEEGVVSEGHYYFDETLDLGGVFTSRLTATIEAYGLDLSDKFFAREHFFEPEYFFGEQIASSWDVALQYRTTNDNPWGAPIWSEWRPFIIGDVTARSYQFRVRLSSYEFGVTPLITRLEVSIDMPDRVVAGNNIDIPSAGLRITFDPPFIGFNGLGTTGQGMASGDRLDITNKDETGFNARFFNASGTAVARTLDYVAKGYGRREA